mgnify:FL=1
MSLQKYGRFWAVYEGEELICITVYKKGAMEVMRRLNLNKEATK